MTTNNTETVARGTSFTTLLQVMLIGLKLAGFIDWPWPLVMAPMLLNLAIIVLLLLFLGLACYAEYRSNKE